MSNDLGGDGGSCRRTTAGDNIGDVVGNDVRDEDKGGNDAGNNASKADGGDAVGRGGELLAEDVVAVVVAVAAQRRLHIAGVLCYILGELKLVI